MGDLTFSVLCVPFLAVVCALIGLGLLSVIVRGDPVMRLAVLSTVAVSLPWASGYVLSASTHDPHLATVVYRAGYGTISLVGPCLMMFILAASGRFDSHRPTVALGFAVAGASTLVCWSTPWMIAGVRETPSGLLYHRPGILQTLHLFQIPLWSLVGVAISQRGMRPTSNARARGQRRRIAILIGLVCTTLVDVLLAHGIGYYPIAWLPGLFAIGVAFYSAARADLFRARGIDQPAIVELLGLLAATGFLFAVTWGGNRTWLDRPLVTGVFVAPLPMLGLVAAWTLRIRRRRVERTSDAASVAIDRFAEGVRDLADEAAVATRLAEILGEHAPVSEVRVWLADERGLRPLVRAEGAAPRIDARVRAWMVANPEPLVAAELSSARLGGLRSLVEELVERLQTDLMVPLVDRDSLIGLAACVLPPFRVLRDGERDFVRAAATTAARGLTFVALTREAGHLASTAREVELAEAVSQARATGDVTVDVSPWQVLGHYRPAARVAGDVWSCSDLGDGRLLMFAGDVVGRGVPSALVSAAVGGVCDAAPALLGATLDPRALLELASRTVHDLGGGTQRVTALAVVLDRGRGTIRWASAGHRGAYLVHPPTGGEDRPRLDLLGGRSTPLGEGTLVIAEGERPLGPDDHLVACSDGVVEVRDGRGEPWGDRRLQRLVRDQIVSAGDRAARMLVAAAVAHAGDAAIADDMLAVVVRPAGAAAAESG